MLLVIVLTAVTLITLDTRNGRSGPLGALGRGAHTIVGPLQRAVDDATRPVGDWWSGVTDSGDIKRDNRRLRQQVAALEGKDRAAQQAIDENESLKKLLGLNSVYDVPRRERAHRRPRSRQLLVDVDDRPRHRQRDRDRHARRSRPTDRSSGTCRTPARASRRSAC